MGRGPGVRAVGTEAIQIDFRWKGVRCRERLRLRPTEANLKYVKRLKATIEHEIATNTFDYARHFPDSPRMAKLAGASEFVPLATTLALYIDSLVGSVQPETIREYRHDAETCASWFKGKALTTLTRADIRREVAKQNLSRARLTNLIKPLRGAFAQAVEDGILKTNPLHGFKIRKIGAAHQVVDPFTPEEVTKLGNGICGNLWTFWAWTGLRSSEIIGLQWGDVERECEAITVRRAVRFGRTKQTKTRSGERRIVLLPAARAALRRERPESAPDDRQLFLRPWNGKSWHEAKALNRKFKEACRKANVRFRYVYQLRHTFATWALSSGENPLWVAKQMGHKDTAMIFKHYGKWMPSLDPQAGSRMAKAVQSKANRGQHAA